MRVERERSNLSGMEDARDIRSSDLRRKIALLRDYLRQGEDTDTALSHLHEIAMAQAELRSIEAAARSGGPDRAGSSLA